jgi:ATP-dependent Lon protease
MPGRIINALKQAKTRNCLILIDEIDKLGSDYKGDPSSALLEVFDTEQNVAFRDHFVELPFDLSDVLFVTTANDLGSIPGPLLDRMEVIELGSYTDEEKLQIAKLYILPKQLKKHGLKGNNLRITDDGIRQLISCYTRESGVRELEREIAKLCRKTAKVMSEEGKKQLRFTKDNLQQYLGTPKFKKDVLEAMPECGLVNGLAWTSVGGELLQVEALALDGTGKLELTGNLGDVMKESARAAISYLRSRADQFGLPKDFYQKKDIHIHFPEGAVPKDGPSAGITTATAIISALTGRPVSKQIAMTGEITLRGRVLPIGGLREKTMAAYKNGVKTVIIPQENKPDLENIDQTVRNHLSFVCASHMDEVVTAVFGTAFLQQTEEAQTSLMTPLPASNPSRSIRTRSSR